MTKIYHAKRKDESLCGIPSSDFVVSKHDITCNKCRDILGVKNEERKEKKSKEFRIKHSAKKSSLPPELQKEIYTHWLCNPQNDRAETAVKFGVTVWMVDTVVNQWRRNFKK